MRVHHCGICHSDYTALHSTYGASPSVLGHEAAGVVDAVGEGVTMVAPGDKVVLTPIAPCGRCYWCQRDQPGCCVNNAAVLGGAFLDGSTGLSRGGQQVFRGLRRRRLRRVRHVQRDRCGQGPRRHPARDRVRDRLRGADRASARCSTRPRWSRGATVLVLGLGGIGLSVVQGARAAGAAQIIASDPLDWRREAASKMGATTVARPERRRRPRRDP